MTRNMLLRTTSVGQPSHDHLVTLRYLTFIFLALGSPSLVCGQPQESQKAFFAGHIGGLASGLQGFDQYYPTGVALVYGGSFGAPIWSRTYAFIKVQYSSKAGVPLTYIKYNEGGVPLPTPKVIDGRFTVRQWVVNLGGMYEIVSSEAISIAVEGGLTHLSFNSWPDPVTLGAPLPVGSVPNHSMAGIFAGVLLEHVFTGSRFSTFIETNYSQLWQISSYHARTYGVVYFSGGIRLYVGAV